MVQTRRAGAQADEASDDKVRAKQFFQTGVSQYESGQYQLALESFQEAYRLKPHPLVRVNMANCYDRLDRPVEALAHFEAFLDSNEGSPEQRDEVKGALKDLRKRVGKLALNVSPDGARITIDDAEERRAPVTAPVVVKAGLHTVVVKLDGYETSTRDVDVKGDATTEVNLRLLRSSEVVAAAPVSGVESAAPASANATAEAEPSTEPKPIDMAEIEGTEPTQGKSRSSTAAWVLGGATVATLVAGTITGILALSADDNFEANRKARFDDRLTETQKGIAWSQASDAASTARALAVTTDVLFGLTIAGAITTTYLFLSHSKSDDRSTLAKSSMAPLLYRNGAGLSYNTQF